MTSEKKIQGTTESYYRPGLQKRDEAVISAHFMHSHNMESGLKLYPTDVFNRKSIQISEEQLKEHIIPALKESVENVIEKRAQQNARNARQKSKDYGIQDANKITGAEIMTEALVDPWFRKGPLENINKAYVRDNIRHQINAGEKIKLVIPLLPNKVDTPLKTKGTAPCMAEINLLCRLAEIAGVINKTGEEYYPDSHKGVEFMILADGHRFQKALNVGEEKVQKYQDSIKWWISELGFDDIITFKDYESEMAAGLDEKVYKEREKHRDAARALYKEAMDPLFNPYDVLGTLTRAIEKDPVPDLENPEARFVPLFKSLLYTYEDDFMPGFCEQRGLDYETLYKDITSHIYEPFDDIGNVSAPATETLLLNSDQGSMPENKMKELFRQRMLRQTWDATIEYLAAVKSDRDLFDDPVAQIFPEHIRYTIHSKKGQIGLCTTGSRKGDPVQAWHGVSQLRASKKNSVKFDNTSRLMAEGNDCVPVTVAFNEAANPSPITELAQKQQPLFYADRKLEASTGKQLCDLIKERLTRQVFR